MRAAGIVLPGAVGFLTAFGAHMIAVGLPAFGRARGLGYAGLGLILASYNLAEMAIKPLAGRFCDRLGPRPVMLWGTAVFTLASFLFPALPVTTLPGLRISQGLGAGALSVSSLALLVSLFPRELGAAIGAYQALKGTGYVCAPLAGGFLARRGGFSTLFLLAGGAGFILLVLQILFGARLELELQSPGSSTPGRRRGRLWPWYLANVIDTALLGILLGFLPVRADELGYGSRAIGFLLASTSAAFLIVQPLAGAVADHLGRRTAVLWGLALGSLGTGMLGVARGAALGAAGMAAGIGLGAAWTNSLARVGEEAHQGRLGGELGLAGSCKDAGDILGPLSFGFIAGRGGLHAAFWAWAVLGVMVVGLLAWAGSEARD